MSGCANLLNKVTYDLCKVQKTLRKLSYSFELLSLQQLLLGLSTVSTRVSAQEDPLTPVFLYTVSFANEVNLPGPVLRLKDGREVLEFVASTLFLPEAELVAPAEYVASLGSRNQSGLWESRLSNLTLISASEYNAESPCLVKCEHNLNPRALFAGQLQDENTENLENQVQNVDLVREGEETGEPGELR